MLEKWLTVSTKYPRSVLTAVVVINVAFFVAILLFGETPNFEDPLLGFEARGTPLSNRINAWKLFTKSDAFTLNPLSNVPSETTTKKAAANNEDEEEEEKIRIADNQQKEFNKRMHFGSDIFCGEISEENVQIVIQSNEDLLTLPSLLAVCELDEDILRVKEHSRNSTFQDICEFNKSGKCCQSWSLPNYVAFVANKSHCSQLNEKDVLEFRDLIRKCLPYAKMFTQKCLESMEYCGKLPQICANHKATISTVIQYLIDEDSLSKSEDSRFYVKTSNIFLPVAKSSDLIDYFNEITKYGLSFNGVEIVAMDLGLKFSLFEKFLVSDLKYISIALVIIIMIIFIYTQSLFITFFVLFTITSSFTTSYFIYTFVYNLSFFPFINLLSVIICVAIGSDNACIFLKYFTQSEASMAPVPISSAHFGRATLSAFVASFTTASAFFAAYSTKITAIKCFSIFSGTVVVCNFILIIMCLPAAVTLNYCSFKCAKFSFNFLKKIKKKCVKTIFMLSGTLIILFVIIVATSAALVFYSPKLRVSNTEVFQLFEDQHLFERYDFVYKNQFKYWQSMYNSDSNEGIPVRIVFGLNPEDNGSYLNPRNRGSLVLNENFNVSRKMQKFLLEFCKHFRNQTYFKPTLGPLLTNCFIETFQSWIYSRSCLDPITLKSRYPCCDSSTFPYNKDVIDGCLKEAVNLIFTGSKLYIDSKWAGFWFRKYNSEVAVVVIEYNTNFTFNNSFASVHNFWTTIDSWSSYVIENYAPEELKNGFIIADYLDTYAFQEIIISGTQLSVCIALAIAVVTVSLSTMDERLTLIAVITIASVILNTVAVLVLIGWQVNVIESICVCIAIGLSVDSTLHYTMAFKLTHETKRKDRLMRVYSLMFWPVTISNLTSMITGCVIRLSVVLPYQQFGNFLVVITVVNWLCSTFFFVPIMSFFPSRQLSIR